MHDKALVIASAADVTTSGTTDATLAPTIAAWVFISDTIQTQVLTTNGPESMTCIITPTTSFATGGTSLVSWKIISTATSDIATELLALSYNTHWQSGLALPSSYIAGQTAFVVPFTPQREYLQYITLIGLFTTDGLSAGAVNARYSRAETMAQFPPANAI